jgi:AraC-like DNA-binding protein
LYRRLVGVLVVDYRKATALSMPGVPFVAWSGAFTPSVTYRSDVVEFVAIVAGEGRRTVRSADGTTLTQRLLPGQMHLFRPRDVHAIEGVRPHGMSALGVGFPLATWERFSVTAEIDRSLFATPDPPMIEFDLDDPAAILPYQRLVALGETGTALDLVEFLSAVVSRFVRSDRSDRTARGQRAPDWLWSAITAMHDEANLKAGAARFGELSHVSPSHLWRSTRRYFGLSPSELILDLQLRHAATLLTSTDERISVIGERCGFTSASHFSKAFRNTHLLSPREYRIRSRA